MKYTMNSKETKETRVILCDLSRGALTKEKTSLEYYDFLLANRNYNPKYKNIEKLDIITGSLENRYIYVGLGDSTDTSKDRYRKLLGKTGQVLKNSKTKSVTIDLSEILIGCTSENLYKMILEIVEGIVLSVYVYKTFKLVERKISLEEINLIVPVECEKEVAIHLSEIETLIENTYIARDFVNQPSNYQTPEMYANEIKKLTEGTNIEYSVYDDDEMKEIGLFAALEVGKASPNKPRLIVLKYKGNKDSDKIVGLVGKGITFDSGGLSLKNKGRLPHMKHDMAGSSTVVGTILAAEKENLKINVTVVIAAIENLLSGNAYKPGDIIDTMGGKTVVIESTDAEGRLALADTVFYAVNNEKADIVIDIATLTGSARGMFNGYINPAMSNNDKLYEIFDSASEFSGECALRLPIIDEARELIQSDIADLRNSAGVPQLGTVVGGAFVEYFVCEKPWIHIDISGAGMVDKDNEYIPKGGTGKHVRNLYHTLKILSKMEEKWS